MQLDAPTLFVQNPDLQLSQRPALPSLYLPRGQVSQSVLFTDEKRPAGQDEQEMLAFETLTLPAGHSRQTSAPPKLNLPGSQSLQTVLLLEANVPAAQVTQASIPSSLLIVPFTHGKHLSNSSRKERCRPAGQTAQAVSTDTDAFATPSRATLPDGQGIQSFC
eukprot:scaffold1552_cov165-Pinguiococcus_pyrenoidosus.AAC.3